ncbi:hypothetical protein LK07_22260 [Streptomyces pluripotens]|uniref:Uncharacterized protein n=1 Tax=Streptomyces pluripotens TaxID=1355015 RepID=A0A221P201_9ACTN|nr:MULTISPECIES: hypothetical protein [Streptomyces]ARP72035.1 hypothetical protein LK06_021100 [Streptomyces pluripotens]ASN26283.1 hypothetical protein LK07_22260 [Streptomyces pluripotens]KIE26429.1 hypothetical protein LK08_14660 [Streptomyces sp. MUSC 125]MCH0560709.1 hypothetical protein [Streptomyces sp. MUM 16J]
MYEPVRAPSPSRSVHSTTAADASSDFPHRSREEELEIQLAGHLAALLTVTDELRDLTPSADLDTAAERLAAQVARLRGGHSPLRAEPGAPRDSAALHRRAHVLAGRALVVAASRADTTAAILAAERMDAHAAAGAAEPKELSSTA